APAAHHLAKPTHHAAAAARHLGHHALHAFKLTHGVVNGLKRHPATRGHAGAALAILHEPLAVRALRLRHRLDHRLDLLHLAAEFVRVDALRRLAHAGDQAEEALEIAHAADRAHVLQ